MPDFSAIQRYKQSRQSLTPIINSYEVIRDSSFVGYKTILKWDYQNRDIFGFKVWRCKSPKVMLKRAYNITQRTLERVTGLRTFDNRNSTLYDKQFFSQNSMVTFDQSHSSRYNKSDETDDVKINRFTEVGFVKRSPDGDYRFVDKNVKFGETYFYVISSINIFGFESPKSGQCTVRIEDLSHPDAPKFVLFLGPSSINVTITTATKAKDVGSFKVFRRQNKTGEEFKQVADVTKEATDTVSFLDFDVIPGKRYEYKVYSVDLFGNVSLSANIHDIAYPVGFDRRGDVPDPKLKVEVNSNNYVIVSGQNNHPDIIGYKIERRDAWRFEQVFERKSFAGVFWPSVVFFDQSGSLEFIDRTANPGRIYQYRISTIRKNGKIATYTLTPHLRIESGYSFPDDSVSEAKKDETVINRLQATIVETKQVPIFTEISWNITGRWDYMTLELQNPKSNFDADTQRIRIDNLPDRNRVHIENLKKNNSYLITAKLYLENNLVGESDNNLNTARVAI